MSSNPISGSSLVGITKENRVDSRIEFLRDIVNYKVFLRAFLYYSNYRIR
jgi:hypothetical protein